MTGKVIAVCISEKRGTQKTNVGSRRFIENFGLEGDAHGGGWHRQVSLLSYDKIREFNARGAGVKDGDFGENLVVEGIDFKNLPVRSRLVCGDVLLEMTQIGKECHQHCQIFHKVGDCIMPREGVFARVIRGGVITAGDTMRVLGVPEAGKVPGFTAAVLTASDKGFAGQREDVSGRTVRQIAEAHGYRVTRTALLPDDRQCLAAQLADWCDGGAADLILTTGGTGFSPRDCMPEATLDVVQRLAPGIPEAMRTASLAITKRAMLSRAAAGIREKTLIVNLPGSPKAVRENLEFVIEDLKHGLEILRGTAGECAAPDGGKAGKGGGAPEQ